MFVLWLHPRSIKVSRPNKKGTKLKSEVIGSCKFDLSEFAFLGSLDACGSGEWTAPVSKKLVLTSNSKAVTPVCTVHVAVRARALVINGALAVNEAMNGGDVWSGGWDSVEASTMSIPDKVKSSVPAVSFVGAGAATTPVSVASAQTKATARSALLAGLRNGRLESAVATIPDEPPTVAPVVKAQPATKAAVRTAVLNGLRSGKLEDAVASIPDESPSPLASESVILQLREQVALLTAENVRLKEVAVTTGAENSMLKAGLASFKEAAAKAADAQEDAHAHMPVAVATGAKVSEAPSGPTDAESNAEMIKALRASQREVAELRQSMDTLKDVVLGPGATRTPDEVQEQLVRSIEDLCVCRLQLSETVERCDLLEQALLESTSAFKARLAESELESERASVDARKEVRVAKMQLRKEQLAHSAKQSSVVLTAR